MQSSVLEPQPALVQGMHLHSKFNCLQEQMLTCVFALAPFDQVSTIATSEGIPQWGIHQKGRGIKGKRVRKKYTLTQV